MYTSKGILTNNSKVAGDLLFIHIESIGSSQIIEVKQLSSEMRDHLETEGSLRNLIPVCQTKQSVPSRVVVVSLNVKKKD